MKDFTEENWKAYCGHIRLCYELKTEPRSFDEYMKMVNKAKEPKPPLTESQKLMRWMMNRDAIADIDRRIQDAYAMDRDFAKMAHKCGFETKRDKHTEKYVNSLIDDKQYLLNMNRELGL